MWLYTMFGISLGILLSVGVNFAVEVYQKRQQYCKSCGARNPRDAVFCNSCGHSTVFPRQLSVPLTGKYCSQCGASVIKDSKFCHNCGVSRQSKPSLMANEHRSELSAEGLKSNEGGDSWASILEGTDASTSGVGREADPDRDLHDNNPRGSEEVLPKEGVGNHDASTNVVTGTGDES